MGLRTPLANLANELERVFEMRRTTPTLRDAVPRYRLATPFEIEKGVNSPLLATAFPAATSAMTEAQGSVSDSETPPISIVRRSSRISEQLSPIDLPTSAQATHQRQMADSSVGSEVLLLTRMQPEIPGKVAVSPAQSCVSASLLVTCGAYVAAWPDTAQTTLFRSHGRHRVRCAAQCDGASGQGPRARGVPRGKVDSTRPQLVRRCHGAAYLPPHLQCVRFWEQTSMRAR